MVTTEIKNRIAYIVLDRAEKRNALNDEMVAALKSAFNQAYASDDCKVIVLKAAGEVFSAGADLAYLKQLQKNSYEENLADSHHLKSLFHQIYTHPKIVIAKIQGHAIAGGCGLASVCDFSLASPETKFGYTEVRIGFIPAIVSLFLIRKIGEGKSRELLLSGELISAEDALSFGLINKVVPLDILDQTVGSLTQNLVEKNSAQSMALTKEMIANIQEMDMTEGLSYAAEMNAKARATEDCKKGMAAFLDKMKLNW